MTVRRKSKNSSSKATRYAIYGGASSLIGNAVQENVVNELSANYEIPTQREIVGEV